jgi:uncharacterized membrane protein HdeD (DUF308 family)
VKKNMSGIVAAIVLLIVGAILFYFGSERENLTMYIIGSVALVMGAGVAVLAERDTAERNFYLFFFAVVVVVLAVLGFLIFW